MPTAPETRTDQRNYTPVGYHEGTTETAPAVAGNDCDRGPRHDANCEGVIVTGDQSIHKQHALYRFYGDDGQLLYVGITNNPGARFTKHQQNKSWWPDVRGISVDWYADRASVMAAETRAISIERPRHNIVRPTLDKRARETDMAAPPPMALVWICATCREPVADHTGYLHVNHETIGEVRRGERDHSREHPDTGISIDALLGMPDPAPWQVHHGACDPDSDSPDYVIHIERARTHAQLLHWTAHLMEKRWLKYTDWPALISRMSAVRL